MSISDAVSGKPPATTKATQDAKKPEASNPAADAAAAKPAPAPAKPKAKSSSDSRTAYNRAASNPIESNVTKLVDAAKKAAQQSAMGSTPSASDSNERKVATESEARRGASTSNDGRTDGGVRDGGHEGNRDEQIAKLEQRQEIIAERRDEVQDTITDLERDIKNKSRESGKVGAVVDVATAPVTAIAGLFGRSNPIGDAAERRHDDIRGLNERVDRLSQQESELARTERQIAAEISKLEQERTLNFLTDVAHVTRMPDSVTNALDGTGNVSFAIVDSTGLDSDAAYSSDDKEIVVDEQVLDRLNTNIDALRSAGIVDGDGNIVDPDAFDRHSAGDAAISTAALLGVHEMTHASQDLDGDIVEAARVGESLISNADAVSSPLASIPFGGSIHDRMMDEAHARAELKRIDMLEYDAYVNQESIEMQAGKEKKGFITINPDGSLLPRDQAVANIYQFQLGQPLRYGPSAGQSFTGVVQSQNDGITPGSSMPGRRAPGESAAGRRAPGETAAGRRAPGEDSPGRRAPGRRAPGDDVPGRRAPGADAPGRRAPGDDAPGRRAPGRRAPGRRAPGAETA